jgi:rhamnogalacturonyl hydrolase YesR
MNSRERLLKALNRQEPDCVPLDLGSTQVTGIHVVAYRGLCEALGLPHYNVPLCDSIQQLALPDNDLLGRLGVDVRGLFPLNSHNWNVREEDGGETWLYHDEWGITHRRPKPDGLYHSIVQVPWPGPGVRAEDVAKHTWPDMGDPRRIAGLHELGAQYRAEGYGVVLKSPFAGIFEMAQRIVGMESCLIMMASDPKLSGTLLDKMLELKLAFWEMALPELADTVDVVAEFDDYGTQTSQLISPRMFRQQLKPRLRTLFAHVRQLALEAKLFFHSCGSVRPIIPDLIEIGVAILNPVHVRAVGMEPIALKHDFGDALVFWGSGVDTQGVLPTGTPQEVKDDVRRNVEALAPGGGYVFSPVHNYQLSENSHWLAGFWTGLLWLAYAATGDEDLRAHAESLLWTFRERLERRVHITHDLGFLFTLSARAKWQLTEDEEAHDLALRPARELVRRYRPAGQYIQAWGEVGDSEEGGRTIIDTMMNLPILFWASEQTGDARYREAALAHAETSRRTLLHPDGASYHTFFFDQASGEPVGPRTHQGYADDSLWARGQAWAIFGFAAAAEWSGEQRFLDASRQAARRFVAELPPDGVPTWDLRLPEDAPHYRDSSAGAIAASGMLRLATMVDGAERDEFHRSAISLLSSLVLNCFETRPDAQGLLRDGTYHAHKGWGVGACFICGDYYFLEALLTAQGNAPDFWGAGDSR